MTEDTAKQALQHCASFLRRGSEWPRESIAAAIPELLILSDDAMRNAIKRISLEFAPGVLPAINRIVDVVRQEQTKLNSVNSPAEPKPRHVQDREFHQQFGGKHDEYAKRSWAIIAMTVDHSVPRERLIEGLGVMEKAYPGLGWGDRQMDEIRKYR